MKSELEKTRDVMEEIHGRNTGLRYSPASNRGANDYDRNSRSSFKPGKTAAPEPVVTPTRMTAREEREVAALIGDGTTPWYADGRFFDRAVVAVLILSALVGAWYGAFRLEATEVSRPLRIFAGAVGAPVALAAAGIFAARLAIVLIEKVLPALVGLAVLGGAIWLALRVLTGQM